MTILPAGVALKRLLQPFLEEGRLLVLAAHPNESLMRILPLLGIGPGVVGSRIALADLDPDRESDPRWSDLPPALRQSGAAAFSFGAPDFDREQDPEAVPHYFLTRVYRILPRGPARVRLFLITPTTGPGWPTLARPG